MPKLLTTYEGVMMSLMLNRSPNADRFKVWAVERLVPAMIRRMKRENPMDAMTPKQRVRYLKEGREIRLLEARKRRITGPLHSCRALACQLVKLRSEIKPDEEAIREVIDFLSEVCEEVRDAIEGPRLFTGKGK